MSEDKPSNRTDPLVPLSIFLVDPDDQQKANRIKDAQPALLDGQSELLPKIIDTIITDPTFRQSFVEDPLQALADRGITFSSDETAESSESIKRQAAALVDAMLNEAVSTEPLVAGSLGQESPHLVPQRKLGPGDDAVEQ